MHKLTDKPHVIFITHGGLVTLKGLVSSFRPDNYQWVVIYTAGVYQLHKLTTACSLGNSNMLNLEFSTPAGLIEFIRGYAESIQCIALDANLTDVCGREFSKDAHDIVVLTACEEALFFTDTESCLKKTAEYLNYRHTSLTPPLTLKRAQVTARANIHSVSFDEIHHPKVKRYKSQGRNSFWCFPRLFCCRFPWWSKIESEAVEIFEVSEPVKTLEVSSLSLASREYRLGRGAEDDFPTTLKS